jgi:hypothetical protein
VRLIVGFPAGGLTDILARLLGQWLSERLGQQFIVEDRCTLLGPVFHRLDRISFVWRTYSIISSARSWNSRVIVSPSADAAFRLMTSSNLLGCSMGRSAGFVPFRILSTS